MCDSTRRLFFCTRRIKIANMCTLCEFSHEASSQLTVASATTGGSPGGTVSIVLAGRSAVFVRYGKVTTTVIALLALLKAPASLVFGGGNALRGTSILAVLHVSVVGPDGLCASSPSNFQKRVFIPSPEAKTMISYLICTVLNCFVPFSHFFKYFDANGTRTS